MKKIKMFLLGAMIIGAASAFTTAKTSELLVLAPDHITFITEESAINELSGWCDNNFTNQKCTYTSANVPNPAGEDGRYSYPSAK